MNICFRACRTEGVRQNGYSGSYETKMDGRREREVDHDAGGRERMRVLKTGIAWNDRRALSEDQGMEEQVQTKREHHPAKAR